MNKKMRTVLAGAAALLLLPTAAVSADTGTPVSGNKAHETHDTLSSSGSVSKVFVTTAAMQLADQGKIDLDAPVTEYLPEFRMSDPRYRNITVRMLMNHSAGLMGTWYSSSMLLGDRKLQPHDNFLQHLSTERLKADPGAYGAYSNDGFNLLELIVERVSGESYTDYLENHICRPLDLQQTGTPWNAFETEEQVRVFKKKTEYTPEYGLTIGDGGVLSTAAELSKFGSAFFTGNTVLLSEKAKNEMRTCQSEDPYEDGFGLGWDVVGSQPYDEAGVQILSKGGDLMLQHAELLVAPDEKISIGVTSAGGSSSINTQLAMALMDIALEEKGIHVMRSKPEKKETTDTVPEQYLQYEGLYISSEYIFELSFPQKKYMKIRPLNDTTEPARYYLYTTEDSFVGVTGNVEAGTARQPAEQTILRFAEHKGCVYLTQETVSGDETFGYFGYPASYFAQQLEENPVSKKVQAAWNARNNKRYYLCGDCASSIAYAEQPCQKLMLPEQVQGYVNTLQITDSTHAKSILHIPSSASRDQTDCEIITENGVEYLFLDTIGYKMISEDAIPDLTSDIREVELTSGAASWYNTDRGTITLNLPEKAAVYVYDRHDRMTYSSYIKNSGKTVVLPPDGKIVFVGETGSTVSIQH